MVRTNSSHQHAAVPALTNARGVPRAALCESMGTTMEEPGHVLAEMWCAGVRRLLTLLPLPPCQAGRGAGVHLLGDKQVNCQLSLLPIGNPLQPP